MGTTQSGSKGFSVKAYPGDAKTLLAFNFAQKKSTANLAGFTIQCRPDGQEPYYLLNSLRFETPAEHAQVATEPATSSINAPFHKFRWLHVPGSTHQGTKPFLGKYTYTVTPRYFDGKSLAPIDPGLGVSVEIDVVPFQKNGLSLGFTRGFVQSQAFVHHFGPKAVVRPKGRDLLFKTSQPGGTSPAGQPFTFQGEYDWLGFTAREKIFALLGEVLGDKNLQLDMFAYDLNEPDIIDVLLQLARQGRIRLILDNATLHHSPKAPKPEDQVEKLFAQAAKKPAAILRGKFGRFAHDKIFIVYRQGAANQRSPVKVLTGSTNFSITGMYVNSNHVLVFEDPAVAAKYADVFQAAWTEKVQAKAFSGSPLAGQTFSFASQATPKTEITFSPHPSAFASKVLQNVVTRITQEGKKGKSEGSVLFAVMDIGAGSGPVFPALKALHKNEAIFSYGVSDSPDGISLYTPRKKTGVLVTGKPVHARLPPPFDQVPSVGLGHQIHHKFVVCGFNGDDPVVFCGSSNLALGGEQANGDNLLAIHDGDVATAFAIEALALVDHFDFLDRCADAKKSAAKKTAAKKTSVHKPQFASRAQEAVSAGWFLSTDDKWANPYFDPRDLRSMDRELFG